VTVLVTHQVSLKKGMVKMLLLQYYVVNYLYLLLFNLNAIHKVQNQYSEVILVQYILLNVLLDVKHNLVMFGEHLFIFKNQVFVKLQFMLVLSKIPGVWLNMLLKRELMLINLQ